MGEQQNFDAQQGRRKKYWIDKILGRAKDLSGSASLFAFACAFVFLVSNNFLSNFLWAFVAVAFLFAVLSVAMSVYADRLERRGFAKTSQYINLFAVVIVAVGGVTFALVIMNFLPQ